MPTGARPTARARLHSEYPGTRDHRQPGADAGRGHEPRPREVATARSSCGSTVTAFSLRDYVERCVDALEQTGAAMVGGAMIPIAAAVHRQRGIAAAMAVAVGRRPGTVSRGWSGAAGSTRCISVPIASPTPALIGGYAEEVAVNEDAEFAIRMAPRGGVWFEPAIRSSYSPRETYRSPCSPVLPIRSFPCGDRRADIRRRSGCGNWPRPPWYSGC